MRNKIRASIIKLLAGFSLLVGTTIHAAHPQEAQAAVPNKLRLMVADDFASDSRRDYEIAEPADSVSWQRGKLTLNSGARVRRTIESGCHLQVELELETTTDQEPIGVQVNIYPKSVESVFQSGVASANPLGIKILLNQSNQTLECQYDDLSKLRNRSSARPRRKVRLQKAMNGPVKLTVSYRYGLVAVSIHDSIEFRDFLFKQPADIKWVEFESSADKTSVRGCRVHGIPQTKAVGFAEKLRLLAAVTDELRARQLIDQLRFAEAISPQKRCADACEQIMGVDHQYSMNSAQGLAGLYAQIGAYEMAVPIVQKTLAASRETRGANHPMCADLHTMLGTNYLEMGEYDRALEHYQKSRRIRESVYGKEHELYAASLSNLALLYQSMGAYSEAEKMYSQTASIDEKLYGKDHISYAVTSYNRALLFELLGKYEESKKGHLQAKRVIEREFGPDHHNTANCLTGLGTLYVSTGELDLAETALRDSLEIRKKTLGETHPFVIRNLKNLAAVHFKQGAYRQAEELIVQSLVTARENMERYSIIQSERQQRRFSQQEREALDWYVSLARHLGGRDKLAFNASLQWKGSTLVRQQGYRSLTHDQKVANTLKQLRAITSRLTNLLQQNPSSPRWQLKLDQLTKQARELERELAMNSARYRELKQAVDALQLVKVLPENAILVDFLEYRFIQSDKGSPNRFDSARHLAAFVVRRDHSTDKPLVQMLDLGDVSQINKLVDSWRGPIERANQRKRVIDVRSQETMHQAGMELRKLIWEPIERLVGDAELVVVCPDGALGRFPLVALPGKKPGTYLIEERRLVSVAVPQLIPRMLERPADPIDASTKALLVGNVAYGDKLATTRINDGRSKLRNRRILGELQFGRLKGTAGEIRAIRKLLPQSTLLEESAAAEGNFKRQISDHQLLHVATHGFFRAPDRRLNEISERREEQFHALQKQRLFLLENPNLLSGLAFANANQSTSESKQPGSEDGILFSAEIALLPMDHVELAILSACETSLGQTGGAGEGLIGIQRAFQVAGVRSTVASYWKVNDQATQMLMNKFYDNLLQSSRGEVPRDKLITRRLDAFRDAQLWMLRGLGSSKLAQLYRGLADDDESEPLNRAKDKRPEHSEFATHPRYWAAFDFSGDWR